MSPSRRAPALLLALLLAVVATCSGVSASAAPPNSSASTRSSDEDPGLPQVLRVGTEGVYTPFSYHDSDGELTGFDIEFMNAVALRLGIEVEYVETPWDSMFAALGSSRFDLVANQVTLNPEREELYDLSDPYIETTGVLVVREDEDEITELADLEGRKAAENLTSNWAEVAKANGAEVVGVEGMAQAIEVLKQGRVDALVNDKLAIANYFATNPEPGIKVVAETDDVSYSVLAARKGSGYLPQLNEAIAELKADGTVDTIYDKYFTAQPDVPTDWELIKGNAWPMLKALAKFTIPLTAISFALGLVLALVVALGRMSKNPFVSGPARAYISVIRGTPLLVQLFIIFFGLPQFGITVPSFPAAVIAFTLNVAGYAAEIIRSSIESLPRGQWEAASTIGMGYGTSLRRVILPQAARTAVPPLSNTLISLLKDTSLAAAILVPELLRQAQIAAAPTFRFFTMYCMAALYYWVVCMVLSHLQSRAETRLNRFVAP